MGVYTYTLRAETRTVDGVEIGHYGYAFEISPKTAERMQIFGAFTNEQRTSEAVFVFPRMAHYVEVSREIRADRKSVV